MTPTETVREFIDAINARHIEKMVGLMTPDHRFVDSLGKEITGRMAMRDAWVAFLGSVPNYRIEVHETYSSGPTVLAVGSAGGTFTTAGAPRPENSWQVPAVWRAVVTRERIGEWQAFVDNEPLRQIMLQCGTDTSG